MDDVVASAFIAWYLFLAGSGAGAYAIAVVVDFALRVSDRLWLLKISPITDSGFVIAPVLVALGSYFLLFDLGDPSAAFNVFSRPQSILGFGSWAIALFCICSVLSLVIGSFSGCRMMRILEGMLQGFAAMLSIAVIVYSGIFYSLFASVPFLNTPIVPFLFVVSAFSSGLGFLIVVGYFGRKIEAGDALDGFSVLDAAIVIIEIVLLVALLARPALLCDGAAAASAEAVTTGFLAPLFWLGVVFLGCVVPLVIDIESAVNPIPSALCIGGVSAIIGGVCLRFCVLMAAIRVGVGIVGAQPFWL